MFKFMKKREISYLEESEIILSYLQVQKKVLAAESSLTKLSSEEYVKIMLENQETRVEFLRNRAKSR